MKIDFGYIWKMFIGGSFTKCKSEIPILIRVFPILLNKKVLPFFFGDFHKQKLSWDREKSEIFWYNFHVKIIPKRR